MFLQVDKMAIDSLHENSESFSNSLEPWIMVSPSTMVPLIPNIFVIQLWNLLYET